MEGENGVEEVQLGKGEMFVVPLGVRHRPIGEAEIMLIERCGVVNTGSEEKSSLTKEVEDARISGKAD
jgi:mannose-6-phosphate isomerase-like protein (cupin superfamily)